MDQDENSAKNYKAPADGERSAMIGYRNQYRVSAYMILQYLKKDKLDWFKIADPKAKQVDDFQICSGARVDFFQIKWSQYPGPIGSTTYICRIK